MEHYVRLQALREMYNIQLSRNFTIGDDADAIEAEYRYHVERIKRSNIYRKLMETSKQFNIQPSRTFTLDDSVADMELEYEHLLQRCAFAHILQGLMILNEKYDMLHINNLKSKN